MFTTVNVALCAGILDPRFCRYIKENISEDLYNSLWNQLHFELNNFFPQEAPRTVSVDTYVPGNSQSTLSEAHFRLNSYRSLFETTAPAQTSTKPLEWWRKQDKSKSLPKPMKEMIQSFLNIPAASSLVERMFSSTGFVSEGRPLLSVKMARSSAYSWLTCFRLRNLLRFDFLQANLVTA
jgi:hypothetical protein